MKKIQLIVVATLSINAFAKEEKIKFTNGRYYKDVKTINEKIFYEKNKYKWNLAYVAHGKVQKMELDEKDPTMFNNNTIMCIPSFEYEMLKKDELKDKIIKEMTCTDIGKHKYYHFSTIVNKKKNESPQVFTDKFPIAGEMEDAFLFPDSK